MTRLLAVGRDAYRGSRGRGQSFVTGAGSPLSVVGGGETLLLVLLPVLASCAALVVSTRTGSTTAAVSSSSSPTTTTVTTAMTTSPVVPADATLVYMSRGTADRLRCPAEADPPVTLIVWSKDGQVVDAAVEGVDTPDDGPSIGFDDNDESVAGRGARLMISQRDNQLIISNVTWSDAGLYTCTAYSPLSTGHPMHKIMVIVKGAFNSVCRFFFYSFVRRVSNIRESARDVCIQWPLEKKRLMKLRLLQSVLFREFR
jgi:hypothetical protein